MCEAEPTCCGRHRSRKFTASHNQYVKFVHYSPLTKHTAVTIAVKIRTNPTIIRLSEVRRLLSRLYVRIRECALPECSASARSAIGSGGGNVGADQIECMLKSGKLRRQ